MLPTDDSDDKVRRNLVAFSGSVVMSAIVGANLSDMFIKLIRDWGSVHISHWRLYLGLLLVQLYLGARFYFSKEVTESNKSIRTESLQIQIQSFEKRIARRAQFARFGTSLGKLVGITFDREISATATAAITDRGAKFGQVSKISIPAQHLWNLAGTAQLNYHYPDRRPVAEDDPQVIYIEYRIGRWTNAVGSLWGWIKALTWTAHGLTVSIPFLLAVTSGTLLGLRLVDALLNAWKAGVV